jgi:hypothetical protein
MRFETVFLYLYDVGRSIDLAAVDKFLGTQPPSVGRPIGRRLDTPASLLLPTPLVVDLDESLFGGNGCFLETLKFRAKLYEEGVVTIECRAEAHLELNELHTFRYREVPDDDGAATLDALADRHFAKLVGRIQKFINQDQYRFDAENREDYHVFCLLDPVDDPQGFLKDHKDYLAPFLLGENPQISLHASHIATTMANPFSFTDRDAAVFDMDRAFLVAPDRDYEDLVLIIEHANYQLLELRALDKLLDKLLDDAERDLRSQRKARGGLRMPSLTQKLGYLQPLRLDALFILENLENSSRIIGDYYLEQIYDHLCSLFNTGGWRHNVEKRLEILQSLYTMTKTDRTDSTMVLMEFLVVVMIGLELIALFLPLVH